MKANYNIQSESVNWAKKSIKIDLSMVMFSEKYNTEWI